MNLKQVVEKITEEYGPEPELIHIQTLRKSIGWLGVSLPFVLWWGGALLAGTKLQPSISHYYYTHMREVFVGVMCAVSLFLFTYKGYNKLDSYAANAAGFFSLLVAIFPTNLLAYPGQAAVISVLDWKNHNAIHLISAGLFFITLACMSLFLFTKSDKPKSQWSNQKKYQNFIYKLSGVMMLLCIVLIGLSDRLFDAKEDSQITFALEAVALFFFGFSWLTKGEVFGD